MYRLRLGSLSAVLVAAALFIAANFAPTDAADGRVLPAHVNAVYRVSFTALGKIGSFRFTSDIAGEVYTLSAEAKINTLDPLSGVMALSLGNPAKPCAQRLPIY